MRPIRWVAAAALAALLPLAPPQAQFRHLGPGVADRTGTITRRPGGA